MRGTNEHTHPHAHKMFVIKYCLTHTETEYGKIEIHLYIDIDTHGRQGVLEIVRKKRKKKKTKKPDTGISE